jgi:hypothetical protein
MQHDPVNNSQTHWLAVQIYNNAVENAIKLIGLPDVDHDAALLEVIRSEVIFQDGGLMIINRIVNGYFIKDVAVLLKECILHGKIPILNILVPKYTIINPDWFYYAWNQLVDNSFAAQRPHNTARWILNYAAENKHHIPTTEIMDILRTTNPELVHAVIDCLIDNPTHYNLAITKLTATPTSDLNGVVLKYLYDIGRRQYTAVEYAKAVLRSHLPQLGCI